jgi:hypothetical protein
MTELKTRQEGVGAAMAGLSQKVNALFKILKEGRNGGR